MSNLITFLLGPEEGLKREELEKRKKALLSSYPDLEIHNYYPQDTDEEDLIRVLYDSSLFSTHRLIIIRHYEEVAKESKINNDLAEFLKDPTDDVTIYVLSTSASTYSISQKILSLIDQKTDVQIFYELFDNQKRSWIIDYFKKNGLIITQDAVDVLLEMVDNNTDDMRHSTENLTIFLNAKGYKTVTESEITAFLQHTKSEDANTLFEYVASKDLDAALSCLHAILLENKMASTSIISTLTMRFRQLEALKLELKTGEDINSAIANIKTLKINDFSFSSLTRKRDKDTMKNASRFYKEDEVKAIISLLLKADNEIKSLQADLLTSTLEYYLTLIMRNGGKESSLTLDRLEF